MQFQTLPRKKQFLLGVASLILIMAIYFLIVTPVALTHGANKIADARPYVICNYRYEVVDSLWSGFRQGFWPVFSARVWYIGDGYFTPYVGIVVNGDDCESNSRTEERYIWSIKTLNFSPAHQVFFNDYTYELSEVRKLEKK